MIELTSDERGEVADEVDLFSLDGKRYKISTEIRPEIGLQYYRMARVAGLGIAESWLAEKVMGTEAFEALIHFEGIKREQWDEIMEELRKVVFGDLGPKAGDRPSPSQR